VYRLHHVEAAELAVGGQRPQHIRAAQITELGRPAGLRACRGGRGVKPSERPPAAPVRPAVAGENELRHQKKTAAVGHEAPGLLVPAPVCRARIPPPALIARDDTTPSPLVAAGARSLGGPRGVGGPAVDSGTAVS